MLSANDAGAGRQVRRAALRRAAGGGGRRRLGLVLRDGAAALPLPPLRGDRRGGGAPRRGPSAILRPALSHVGKEETIFLVEFSYRS